MLVLITDGISEVVDTEHSEFGEDRLHRAAMNYRELPLPELFTALYEEACAFSAEGTIGDDVCLVGFRLPEDLGY